MTTHVTPKRRVSTGKALAFWPLLALTMLVLTNGLGAAVERTVDQATAFIEQRGHLFENIRY